MDDKQKPLGVRIFGGLNCFIFGFLFLVVFLATYIKITPQDLTSVTALFKKKGLTAPITYRQFKVIVLVYIALTSIVTASGTGLLAKKEWARKVTVYFSFVWLLFISLAVLLNPGLVTQVIAYAAYPGLLIVYFTNKKIETYFKS